MNNLLKPQIQYSNIYSVDIFELKKKGIKGLILDIDNTLTQWKATSFDKEVLDWINYVQSLGIKVCLVSNGKTPRIKKLLVDTNILFISQAKKPTTIGLKKALIILDTKPNETALIGDQIFTDILGGNRLGLLTILVEPINKKHEFKVTKLLRLVEKIVVKRK